MNENDEDVVHPGIVTKSQKAQDSGLFCNSPPTGPKLSKTRDRASARTS
jgi:hypothetical protein